MENLEAELAKTRRDLRNWRWFAAVSVMLTGVVVVMAGIPYIMR